METILDSPTQNTNTSSDYAGFWLRFLALVIDGILVCIAMGAVVGIAVLTKNFMIIAFMYGAAIIGGWLYFALMESSEKQATFGKLAMGLKVTNIHGERISFGNATGRHFAKILSGMIMYIGYIMAGFTEKKQGLHDIIAETLVIRK